MADTRPLSKQALEAHNKTLQQGSSSAYSEPGRQQQKRTLEPSPGKRRPANLQVSRLMQQDNRSVRSLVKSDTASHQSSKVHSNQSISSLLRMRKKLGGRWKGGKVCSVSLNNRDKALPIALENNYKLEPEPECKFNTQLTKQVVEEVVKEHLDTVDDYDATKCVTLSREISDEIKSRVKELGFARYKIVAHVVIGEDRGQGVQVCSRGVWDTSKDNMTPFVYRNKNLFAVATVFGTYFE